MVALEDCKPDQLGFMTIDEWNLAFKVGHSKGAEMLHEFKVEVVKLGPKLSRIPISEYRRVVALLPSRDAVHPNMLKAVAASRAKREAKKAAAAAPAPAEKKRSVRKPRKAESTIAAE